MKTLDKLIIIWCAVSLGFSAACFAGWLASSVAISAGKGEDMAAGVVVLIIAGSAWLTGAWLAHGFMTWLYSEEVE